MLHLYQIFIIFLSDSNSHFEHMKHIVNPLTAGAAYIRVFIFISTLSTTF